MGSSGRAWIAAASIGAVEALKDQGICRWNYAFRSFHQHAKKNIGSFSESRRVNMCSMLARNKGAEEQEKLKQSEESLRKVMYLSCWGPN